MAIPWIAAAMAAAGYLKGMRDKDTATEDRRMAAVEAKGSPWTGIKPRQIKEGDVIGSTVQGGLAGFGMDQNLANSEAVNNLMGAKAASLNGEYVTAAEQDLIDDAAAEAVHDERVDTDRDYRNFDSYATKTRDVKNYTPKKK